MLTDAEQKAGLVPYAGARMSPTTPLAVRPDGSVQFAFETADPTGQVVDHYVGELNLTFSNGAIEGQAKGRNFNIEINPQGSGTLVKVTSTLAKSV